MKQLFNKILNLFKKKNKDINKKRNYPERFILAIYITAIDIILVLGLITIFIIKIL